jgi:ATP-dependent RNA helicase DDX5/DBP2
MAREETTEERAARKAHKKVAKKEEEKPSTEEKEKDKKPSKKRKATESTDEVVNTVHKISKHDINDDAKRTKSHTNAEEVSPTSPSSEEFRKVNQLQVTGKSDSGDLFSCPDPMTAFAMTPFAQPIRKALDAAGFPNPTPTQAQVWPIALAGRDVITVAKTGSGKTCGFLLPAFHRLLTVLRDRRRGPPGILVLAPTRELACQIEEECVKFGRSSNIRSVCAYGGAPKSLQVRKIQNGIEVLIATPGRLNDLLEMRVVDLSQVVFLVLDEADRMLDMGFEPQVRVRVRVRIMI